MGRFYQNARRSGFHPEDDGVRFPARSIFMKRRKQLASEAPAATFHVAFISRRRLGQRVSLFHSETSPVGLRSAGPELFPDRLVGKGTCL